MKFKVIMTCGNWLSVNRVFANEIDARAFMAEKHQEHDMYNLFSTLECI